MQYFSWWIQIEKSQIVKNKIDSYCVKYLLLKTTGGRGREPHFSAEQQIACCRVTRTLLAGMRPL